VIWAFHSFYVILLGSVTVQMASGQVLPHLEIQSLGGGVSPCTKTSPLTVLLNLATDETV